MGGPGPLSSLKSGLDCSFRAQQYERPITDTCVEAFGARFAVDLGEFGFSPPTVGHCTVTPSTSPRRSRAAILTEGVKPSFNMG